MHQSIVPRRSCSIRRQGATGSVPSGLLYRATSVMALPEHHSDYTLQALYDYSEGIIRRNFEKEESDRTSICIAIAGGGSQVISTLASTDGASTLLLEGIVTYDRTSFQSYVNVPVHKVDFKSSSYEAAKLASEVALKRALQFRATNVNLMPGCVGVACASALVSSSSPDSVKGYGHVVATRADGCQLSIDVTLANYVGTIRRTRLEEDAFMSNLVLRAVDIVQAADASSVKNSSFKTDVGDTILETWRESMKVVQGGGSDDMNGSADRGSFYDGSNNGDFPNPIDGGDDGSVDRMSGGPGDSTDGSDPGDGSDEEDDVVIGAATRIVSGASQVELLLPVYKDGKPVSFQSIEFPVIPRGSLVFPGSYNPPHAGHMTLAGAAVEATMQNVEKLRRIQPPPIFMEMSLTNADKPPIDPSVAAERVKKFLELKKFPEKWGLLLTNAPLFAEKVQFLKTCIADPAEDGPFPKLSFVVGTDTLVRIIDPKYYGNCETLMLESMRSMDGVHFVVGGRLEQRKDKDSPQFVGGRKEVEALPDDVRSMFTVIKEEDFRMDISSSELRQREHQVDNNVPV